MKKTSYLLIFLLLMAHFSYAQLLQTKGKPTRADSLRGGLRPERTHFDVLKYDLSVEVDPVEKYISGKNKIDFKVLADLPVMQLDLFKNMKVDSIVHQGKKLTYKREYNAVFIEFPKALKKGEQSSLDFYYSGHPTIAKKPPWDGGFIFKKDKNGKDWISVAVQGTGASLWYPNKDTQTDKPEEAEIHVTVPRGLKNISNGRLTNTEKHPDGRSTWSWKVTYPINNYNLVLNIGDYEHFSDKLGDLDLDYYVLSYNLDAAKKQFHQVKPMLNCFQEKFGEYPFKRDGYKLIETPYLGMEHQSGIGYGNDFKNGYEGKDISQTGVGLKFDFIIVHESGHEWFGNSVTAADVADMWIHEAFTSYAEAVYIECRWGKKEALRYLNGLRQTRISNDKPITGPYGINREGSSDMYYKGANMLHTLRTVINDDEKWWKIIKDFHTTFKYQIIEAEDVFEFFNEQSGLNLTPIFEQYLQYTKIPRLEFKKDKGVLFYRWEAEAVNFEMPINISLGRKNKRIVANKYWQELDIQADLRQIRTDQVNNYIKLKLFK